jgi:hypothetical protein
MKINLIKNLLAFFFLCFFNRLICQDNVRVKADNFSNEKSAKCNELIAQLQSNVERAQAQKLTFYSSVSVTNDYKIFVAETLLKIKDRIYNIEFSSDGFKIQANRDLERIELYQFLSEAGLSLYAENDQHQKVKYINGQEIIIPAK